MCVLNKALLSTNVNGSILVDLILIGLSIIAVSCPIDTDVNEYIDGLLANDHLSGQLLLLPFMMMMMRMSARTGLVRFESFAFAEPIGKFKPIQCNRKT